MSNTGVECQTVEQLHAQVEELQRQLHEREQAYRLLQEQTRSLETMFHRTTVGLATATLDGLVVQTNPAFQKLLGYTSDELHGMNVADFTHPDDFVVEDELLQALIKGRQESLEVEKRYLHKDGHIVLARAGISRIDCTDEQSTPMLIAYAIDITKQRHQEVALKELEERFRLALEASRDGLWDWNFVDNTIYCSPRWQTMLGYDLTELFSDPETWKELIHPDDKPYMLATVEECLHHGMESFEIEYRLRTQEGDWKWMLSRGRVVARDEHGNAQRMVGTNIDITSRKQIQHDLTLAKFSLDRALDMVIWFTGNGQIVYANDAASQILGYSADELHGMSIAQLSTIVTDDSLSSFLEQLREQQSMRFTTRHRRKDGSIVPTEVTVNMLTFDGNDYVCEFTRDMTEHIEREDNLRVFKALIDHSPDAIGIALPTGVITYANQAFIDMFGYGEETIGKINVTLFSLEDQQTTIPTLPKGVYDGPWKGILTGVRRDGSTFPADLTAFAVFDENGEPKVMPAILRDLTAQVQAEQERIAWQQQIIEAQQQAIRELSAPLLPISHNIVVLPLIGTIDSTRAQDIMETLLEGIAEHDVRYAILDITGVKVVDTQVAQTLLQTAQAIRLLGAHAILTGIRPAIAQTLIHLGVDLSAMTTRSTLEDGINYASLLERSSRDTPHALKCGGFLGKSIHR